MRALLVPVLAVLLLSALYLAMRDHLTPDRDLQVALVRGGSAWHFRPFDDEQTREERRELAAAEAEARRAKRGLWAEPDPMPPWECRELLRELKTCR